MDPLILNEKLERLNKNQDYIDIIVTGFIYDKINDFVLEDDIDNEHVRDELKARKILNDYFSDIINSAKILKLEKED